MAKERKDFTGMYQISTTLCNKSRGINRQLCRLESRLVVNVVLHIDLVHYETETEISFC